METAEEWRTVQGFEGRYEVSDMGRIRSLPRTASDGRRIKGGIRKSSALFGGYRQLQLHGGDGIRTPRIVHRLVLTTFVGDPPEGAECCHINGDPADNRLVNLRWGTRAENIDDQRKHGTGHVGRTECPRGHPYDAANTYVTPAGSRACKACRPDRRNKVAPLPTNCARCGAEIPLAKRGRPRKWCNEKCRKNAGYVPVATAAK